MNKKKVEVKIIRSKVIFLNKKNLRYLPAYNLRAEDPRVVSLRAVCTRKIAQVWVNMRICRWFYPLLLNHANRLTRPIYCCFRQQTRSYHTPFRLSIGFSTSFRSISRRTVRQRADQTSPLPIRCADLNSSQLQSTNVLIGNSLV